MCSEQIPWQEQGEVLSRERNDHQRGLNAHLGEKMGETSMEHIWLEVWNMAFIFPFLVGMMIQSDELIFFRGVETSN